MARPTGLLPWVVKRLSTISEIMVLRREAQCSETFQWQIPDGIPFSIWNVASSLKRPTVLNVNAECMLMTAYQCPANQSRKPLPLTESSIVQWKSSMWHSLMLACMVSSVIIYLLNITSKIWALLLANKRVSKVLPLYFCFRNAEQWLKYRQNHSPKYSVETKLTCYWATPKSKAICAICTH